ncbi:MAG: hypothetical protein DHS20C15_29050 [Planctomycetota bacterium]|nr:MAG: hypothetical protein DHS20C15_29050 [Planctomycetota bacterium]
MSAPRHQQREQGSFVVLVSVIGLLSMAFWMSAYRATHDALRMESQLQRAARHAAFVDEGLRLASSALEHAEPPRDHFRCLWFVKSDLESGWLTAIYERVRHHTWSVMVAPASERDLRKLPKGETVWP